MIRLIPRRRFLAGACAVLAVPHAFAHHGWSSFDTARPIYLAGKVAAVRWQNPHAELKLELAAGLKLPPDLAKRAVPAQQAAVDGPAVLSKAALPQRSDRQWTIELAPLSRMQAWKVEPIRVGETVELVGYTTAGEKGEPVLRVEYLFHNGQAYGLRSSPN
jgi:hypothetical protein